MNKSKFEDVRRIAEEIVLNEKESKAVVKYCAETYNMPKAVISDLLNGRYNYESENAETIFMMLSAIKETGAKDINLPSFFSDMEIDMFSGKQYAELPISFPLVIPCIEVDPGRQWIGKIDARTLLGLYNLYKIKYNVKKQRVGRMVSKDGIIQFGITVIERSVNQIADLMRKGEYIPDDITLDIPEETDPSLFEYKKDENQSVMIFHEGIQFDITDGYHRFLAMKKCYEKDRSFNYTMELRITKFLEQRSRQFIYQKDQKNKMTKSQSKSMNTMRYSNEIVDRLNEAGTGSYLSGLISRSGGRCDYSALSDVIEYFWCKGKDKISPTEIIGIKKEAQGILNGFLDEYTEYFDESHYLDFRRLVILFWLVKEKNKSVKEAGQMLQNAINNNELSKITTKVLRKSFFDNLATLDYGMPL